MQNDFLIITSQENIFLFQISVHVAQVSIFPSYLTIYQQNQQLIKPKRSFCAHFLVGEEKKCGISQFLWSFLFTNCKKIEEKNGKKGAKISKVICRISGV